MDRFGAVQSELKDPDVTSIRRVLQILYHTDLKTLEQRLLKLIPRCDLMTIHLIQLSTLGKIGNAELAENDRSRRGLIFATGC